MEKKELKLAKIAFTILITLAFLQQASAEQRIELQESSQCGNIVCEAGENRTECAIDCGSALSHMQFSDMMGLFEIAFYTPSEGAEHFPGVAFFIGDPRIQYSSLYSSGLGKYCYVSATNNHNHEKWSRNTAINRGTFVELTETDIDNIFDDYGTLTKYNDSTYVLEVVLGKLERLDIEKFYQENYPSETYSFGVQTDSSLNLIVDENNNLIPDSPIEDYQNGKTIVYPIPFTEGKGLYSRPFYNFNNPVVRDYAIRHVLKAQEKCGTNLIFMDNFLPREVLFYDNASKKKLFYVSSIPTDSSSSTEHIKKQAEIYIGHLLEILKEVKARNQETKFILNGYTPHLVSRNAFIDIATENEQNKNSFEMIMFENTFHERLPHWIMPGEYGFPGYYPQIQKLYKAGKNALFAAGEVYYLSTPALPANYKAYKIWLWTHLVGNGLSYLYINYLYSKPMISYTTYSYKLGQPLEDPQHDGNIWSRKFERGTIVFDTTSKKLDAIKFIEDANQACGNSACDSDIGETTESCPADCPQTQQCGNGQIDSGENCSNCPADVQCAAGQLCCVGTCTTPACNAASGCPAGQICISAGECGAQCVAGCTIDDDCQSNQLCCNRACRAPACWQGSDCPSGQICINPGQCNAACAVTGCITDACPSGQICCNDNCIIAECSAESDCDDASEATIDECSNAGSCTAHCTHEQIIRTPPIVNFQRYIETGKVQIITLTTEEGVPIRDFNVLLTFPNQTTAKFSARNGVVAIAIETPGTFNATAQTQGFEIPFRFEAKAPPPVDVNKWVGPETTERPNYWVIWLLAIAVISGLLMAITRLKPLWFRLFMASTYTTLPFAVRYYTQNTWIAFTVIAIQTTILTALWFKQWKKQGIEQKKEEKEWKQTAKKETGAEKEPKQPSSEETTGKGWSELQRELERVKEKETAQATEEEEWIEFTQKEL